MTKTHVGVVLLLIQNNSVLLMRRTTKHFGEGLYAAPGGKIDGREPLRSALIREIKEEIGIDVTSDALKFETVLHIASHKQNLREVILFVFSASNFTGQIQNLEPHKCDDVRFFPLDQLPENILPAGTVAIENMLRGVTFGELYWDEEVPPIE